MSKEELIQQVQSRELKEKTTKDKIRSLLERAIFDISGIDNSNMIDAYTADFQTVFSQHIKGKREKVAPVLLLHYGVLLPGDMRNHDALDAIMGALEEKDTP